MQWMFRWEVESTTSGKVYTVAMTAQGHWACSCPAWKFKKQPRADCKHILRVKALEERFDSQKINRDHMTATQAQVNRAQSQSLADQQPGYFVLQTRRTIILED